MSLDCQIPKENQIINNNAEIIEEEKHNCNNNENDKKCQENNHENDHSLANGANGESKNTENNEITYKLEWFLTISFSF